MIRYIFSDIDRTLLGSNGKIPEYNLQAIERARKNGVGFVIVSGRAGKAAFPIAEMTGIRENEVLISNNGADLIDHRFEFIKHTPFPKEESDRIISYLLTRNVALRVFTMDDMTDYRMRELCDRFDKDKMPPDHSREELLNRIKDREIEKISLSYRDDIDPEELERKLREITGNRIECSYLPTSRYMETNYVGQNKGNAIIEFCASKHIDVKDTAVMGDTYNDQTMYRIGTWKACPANAADDIKQMSDYIAERNCDEGAVGEIIDYILEHFNREN